MRSRTHNNNLKRLQDNINEGKPAHEAKNDEPIKTAKDDLSICLFCNRANESIEANLAHMRSEHNLDIPFVEYIKNLKGCLQIMVKKIFDYVACLSCDSQTFKNYSGVQNHMLNKHHTYINLDDLDEHLYKYYDRKRLLAIEDRSLRMTKEFKHLKFRLKLAKNLGKKKQEVIKEEDEDWVVLSDEENKDANQESEDDDFDPVTLPNGELLLENGTM